MAKTAIVKEKDQEKVKRVRFTKNPTGMFGLAYSENVVINRATFPEEKIQELISKGYLEECE